ncbi:MAG TPA: 4Fe-4S cluster-binding domain-containing protein, partial [Exilispira sp.]|nr:4Fe-4S cluster-binding domain-containing protein [Exilispira sp.]
MSDRINICEMHFPLLVLGYGRRLGIWVSGCLKNCTGCISPEFKGKSGYLSYSISYLRSYIIRIIHENQLNGITISGGEPFLQWKQLRELILPLKEQFPDLDILVYTGFKFNSKLSNFFVETKKSGEIQNQAGTREENIQFDWLDILIDGEYKEELTRN